MKLDAPGHPDRRERTDVASFPPGAHVTIVRTGGLGDTILLLPTLARVCSARPDARVTLVGSVWAEALQPLLPFDVRVLHVDHAFPAAHRARVEDASSDPLVRASSAVVVYTAAPDSDFVAHLRHTCPGRVLTWPVAPAGRIHAAQHLAEAVASISSESAVLPSPVLRCSGPLRLHARRWLDQELGTGVGAVAMHPGSGGRWKCWPAARMAALAAHLHAPILLVEGPADGGPCREFCALVDRSVRWVRTAGLSLPDLAALLVGCRGYVGNDSGVSHLAAALGVPTVAVFGPTDPAVWAPLGPRVRIAAPRADASWPTVDEVSATACRLFHGASGIGA